MIRTGVAMILLALCIAGPVCADDDDRTISVSGMGQVAVPPDMARLRVSVVERNDSLSVAQGAVADVTARILKLLGGLGIDRKYINSTGASVQPNYRWNRDKDEQELIGYIAERRIEVEIRDLEILGKIVEGAVEAGANQVSPPVLDSTRRRDAHREALAKAAEDARENAETLAGALGVKLGPVVEINAVRGSASPQPIMRGQVTMAASAESAPASYSAGDIRFEASVNAVFTLVGK
jgi:uncharacterized protein YggE